jgi:hypothetical protein
MIAEKGRGRDGGDRATPDTCCSLDSTRNRLSRVRSLIVGAALALQRFDAAVIAAAVALTGWPR